MLVRETTLTVVRGLGRAFLCLSVSAPLLGGPSQPNSGPDDDPLDDGPTELLA